MKQYLAEHEIISDTEMCTSVGLKAEASPHQYWRVQPSYRPFAIWDTPLCHQLSADGKE